MGPRQARPGSPLCPLPLPTGCCHRHHHFRRGPGVDWPGQTPALTNTATKETTKGWPVGFYGSGCTVDAPRTMLHYLEMCWQHRCFLQKVGKNFSFRQIKCAKQMLSIVNFLGKIFATSIYSQYVITPTPIYQCHKHTSTFGHCVHIATLPAFIMERFSCSGPHGISSRASLKRY